MSGLTGKKRYRIQKRWFRRPLLVLQVQYKEWDGYYFTTTWIDARPEWEMSFECR